MADFETPGMNMALYAGLEESVAAQSDDATQLLDVRTQAQFTGQVCIDTHLTVDLYLTVLVTSGCDANLCLFAPHTLRMC